MIPLSCCYFWCRCRGIFSCWWEWEADEANDWRIAFIQLQQWRSSSSRRLGTSTSNSSSSSRSIEFCEILTKVLRFPVFERENGIFSNNAFLSGKTGFFQIMLFLANSRQNCWFPVTFLASFVNSMLYTSFYSFFSWLKEGIRRGVQRGLFPKNPVFFQKESSFLKLELCDSLPQQQ